MITSQSLVTSELNIRLATILFFAFIFFTILGTLSHECGHAFVAKLFGYETKIGYAFSSQVNVNKNETRLHEIYRKRKIDILRETNFPEKEEFRIRVAQSRYEHLVITIGGPAQTILTSLIAFCILISQYRKHHYLNFKQWSLVFFSHFILREIFNLISVLLFYFQNGKLSNSGDEIRIAEMLHLPLLSIQIVLGLFGLVLALYVIFKIIPIHQRFTFIISGLLGGLAGFWLWLVKFGPIILP